MPLHLIKITASVLHKIAEIVTINFLFIYFLHFWFWNICLQRKGGKDSIWIFLFVFTYTEYFLCVTKNSG